MLRFLLSRIGLSHRPVVGMFARDVNTGRDGMLTDYCAGEFKLVYTTNEANVTTAQRQCEFVYISEMLVRPIKRNGSYYFDWNKVA